MSPGHAHALCGFAPVPVISITAKGTPTRETRGMSHAYARNYIHLIFGTRESRKLIKPAIEIELRKALRGIAVQYGIDLIEIGATEDHLHLLVCIPPKIGVAVAVRVFKAESAKQVNEAGHFLGWAQGYGAFSVSASNLDSVVKYVREQTEYHRSRTFEEEFRSFLVKHGFAQHQPS